MVRIIDKVLAINRFGIGERGLSECDRVARLNPLTERMRIT
jgi:hypothetical protein|tara:strand:- start:1878 stop:2000 length:123 start_codon:yes stop_codon:yes gene_type:complete